VPSQPAQLYEAGLTALVGIALIALVAAGAFRRADGRLLLLALGVWAMGRIAVAATWRDVVVLGPFRADQLVSIGVAGVCFAALALRTRPAGAGADAFAEGEPHWPDPDAARGWRSRSIRRG
jgi:prolipoprotein diacylglyceryltransferase